LLIALAFGLYLVFVVRRAMEPPAAAPAKKAVPAAQA
jgi:hypothetical protein